MASNYFVFGLLLRSNLSLPGLVPLRSPASLPDLNFHLSISPYRDGTLSCDREELRFASPYLDEKGEPVLRVWQIASGTHLRLAYCDGTQIWLDGAGTTLWATWPDFSSLENTASYLLGPAFGVLLRLRGTICLHGSAVSIKDRSIGLLGPQGAGKSTTAAAFVRLGHAAISDDIVALDEAESRFRVLPAYPHLALCPEAADALFGSSDVLPRISPDWDKRRLALGSEKAPFEERVLPLGAIYLLGERQAAPAPFVETVPGSEALMALVVNSFPTSILDEDMRARELQVFGRLGSSIPVRRVIPHEDPARIDELCQVIREDFRSL